MRKDGENDRENSLKQHRLGVIHWYGRMVSFLGLCLGHSTTVVTSKGEGEASARPTVDDLRDVAKDEIGGSSPFSSSNGRRKLSLAGSRVLLASWLAAIPLSSMRRRSESVLVGLSGYLLAAPTVHNTSPQLSAESIAVNGSDSPTEEAPHVTDRAWVGWSQLLISMRNNVRSSPTLVNRRASLPVRGLSMGQLPV